MGENMTKTLKNFRLDNDVIAMIDLLVKVYQIETDKKMAGIPVNKKITKTDVLSSLVRERIAAEKLNVYKSFK